MSKEEQRPKVVRDIVFTCVVLHNMLKTHHDGAVSALQNEQGPYDNYRNPSREAISMTY